jgi:hypothetical protein
MMKSDIDCQATCATDFKQRPENFSRMQEQNTDAFGLPLNESSTLSRNLDNAWRGQTSG